MLCIRLKNPDPYFCLAAEEFLLKNFSDDIFMLWQSNDTVVVGKHQNALAEINYPYVRENNITVARRISGGGTVFHDAGNVNFSFIKNVSSPAEISFKLFTAPVVEALAKLGLKATTSGRNDLLLDGLKISGNAEHVFKNRVLHHGTLLFNSDLDNLGKAIKVVPGKYQSKAVQSNRSPVGNIASFLQQAMSFEQFMQFMLDVQLQKEGACFYELQPDEIETISKLAREKFESWDWRFAYSPKYTFRNLARINDKTLDVFLQVKKGHIEEATLGGDFFSPAEAIALAEKLPGERHDFDALQALLNTGNQELIYSFF